MERDTQPETGTDQQVTLAWLCAGLSVAVQFMPVMMAALGVAAAAAGMVLANRAKVNGPFVVALIGGVLLLPGLLRYLG